MQNQHSTATEVEAYSPKSGTSLQLERLETELGDWLRPTDIAQAMDRLSANYGPPRDRTPDQVRLMVAEWFRALKDFRRKSIGHAVDKHMRTSKWWPTLAEIHQLAKEHQDGWVDALGIGTKPSFKAESYTFAREGRTEAEEVAHRAAQTLRWKQEARRDHPEVPDPIEVKTEPKSASLSGAVSFALYHSCHARRARGEETCKPDCFKAKPGVRTCNIDKSQLIEAGLDDLDVSQPDPATEPHQ